MTVHHKRNAPMSRRLSFPQALHRAVASARLGFTLIEMLVVVTIISLLVAFAIPLYGQYVRRSQISEAVVVLSDYQVKLEQYFQDNRKYGSALCADVASPSWSNFKPANARYFTFGCTVTGGGTGYKLTAKGVAGRAVGHEYTVTESGAKSTTMYDNEPQINKGCWLQAGGEC